MKVLAMTDTERTDGQREPRSILALTDASVLTGGKPLFLPHAEHSYVMSFSAGILTVNTGKKIAPRFTDRYCGSLTIAAVLWDMDELARCRALGLPYTTACSFDFSVPRGATVPFSAEVMDALQISITAGGESVQWQTATDAPDWRNRLSEMSRLFTFRTGDLILPALGKGLSVKINDHVCGKFINTNNLTSYKILDFNIK